LDENDYENPAIGYPLGNINELGLLKIPDATVPYISMRCVSNESYDGYYVSDYIRDHITNDP
jgi:hypothetical protein